MNNFEKWKQDLDIAELSYLHTMKIDCEDCPARHKCNDVIREGAPKVCSEIFKEWAETEVVEENILLVDGWILTTKEKPPLSGEYFSLSDDVEIKLADGTTSTGYYNHHSDHWYVARTWEVNEVLAWRNISTDKDASDNVNHPAHYTGGDIECIDAIASAIQGLKGKEAYYTGNAIKYLWRWKKKNGVEDLKKAKWYIEKLIGIKEAK